MSSRISLEHLLQYEMDEPAPPWRSAKVPTLPLYRATNAHKISSSFYQGPTSKEFKVGHSVLAARETALGSAAK